MSLALDQHPLVQDTVGPQSSIRLEVFAINRTPAPGSGPPRSAFQYLVDLLRITRSGSEQFQTCLNRARRSCATSHSPVLEPPAMIGMLRKSAAFVPRYYKFESIPLQRT